MRKEQIQYNLQKKLTHYFALHKYNAICIIPTLIQLSQSKKKAHIHLSIYAIKNNSKEVLAQIKKNKKQIHYYLNQILRHQHRSIPHLHFHLDNTLNEAIELDSIFNLMDNG